MIKVKEHLMAGFAEANPAMCANFIRHTTNVCACFRGESLDAGCHAVEAAAAGSAEMEGGGSGAAAAADLEADDDDFEYSIGSDYDTDDLSDESDAENTADNGSC